LINILIKPDTELLGKSIAKYAASEMNYNTIENDGNDEDLLEKISSKLEADVGRVFKKMKKTNNMISREDMSILLYFGSYLFVNVPHFRNNIKRFQESVAEGILDFLTSDLSVLKSAVGKTNIPNKESIDIQIIANSYKYGKIKVKVSKNVIVRSAINQVDNLFKILARMYWCFHVIIDDAYYITSDTPILPISKDGFFDRFAPGFATADAVVFPLTKKVCLVGQWQGECANIDVTGDAANGVNASMLKFSNQLYMPITRNEFIDQMNRYK